MQKRKSDTTGCSFFRWEPQEITQSMCNFHQLCRQGYPQIEQSMFNFRRPHLYTMKGGPGYSRGVCDFRLLPLHLQ